MDWDADDPLALIEGESTKENQALHDYAELGPGRSLAKLAAWYQSGAKAGPPTKRLNTLKEWSAAFDWQARVAAADDLARRREREAAAAVRAERAKELADRNWALSQKLADRALQMLDFPLAVVEQVTKTRQGADGRTTEVHMNVVRPAKWSFQTTAIIADIAAKLAALAVDQPTERTAHVIDGITPHDLEEMPIEQLLALRAQIERGKR